MHLMLLFALIVITIAVTMLGFALIACMVVLAGIKLINLIKRGDK